MNLAGGILPFIGFWPAIALAIVGSAVLGAINGLAAVALRIPPFIATLAMSLALGGLAMLTTSGTPVHYPDPFFAEFGRAKILGVPCPVYVFLGFALALGLFLSRTKYGIMIYAIGGNPRAARLSGIPIETITIFIYTLSGLLGGIAESLSFWRARVQSRSARPATCFSTRSPPWSSAASASTAARAPSAAP